MIPTAELELHIRNTRMFIDADPTPLNIWRPTPKVSDGAGGKRPGVPTVASVEMPFRLIPQSRNSTDVTSQTAAGFLDHPRFVIMATPDFMFVKDDFFEWKGFEWKITSVHETPEYESKADVVRGRKL